MTTHSEPNGTAPDGPWAVYSHEHRAWWRASHAGYSPSLMGAGIYSREEAKEIQQRANGPSIQRNEQAMSLTQALAEEREKHAGPRPGDCVFDVLCEALHDVARLSVRIEELEPTGTRIEKWLVNPDDTPHRWVTVEVRQ